MESDSQTSRRSAAVNAPKVSIAIPVYNEQSVLPQLIERTLRVLDSLPGGPHEMVFADDGSSDRTFAVLQQAAEDDSRIVAVSLSRNFGHQAALSAALDHATGDVVVVMDGDLQDPPEVIPQFLEAYHQDFDVVYAVRVNRKEGLVLRLCYHAFYRIIEAVADLKLPVGAGDFALLSRRVVDFMRQAPERHRYLRGLRTWVGFRQTGIEVERDARHAGASKYSLRKLFQLAFDGIFAFSTIPLRMATVLGALTIVGALLYSGFALYARFVHPETPQGFTTIILAVAFLSGVQLLFLGLIGEYIARIYDEVKRRPQYIVDKVVGRD